MLRVTITLAALTVTVLLVSLLCARGCVARVGVGACGILAVATVGSFAALGSARHIWNAAWLALTLLLGGVALAQAAPLFSERAVQIDLGGVGR
jgi:hypothetical protein